MYGLSGNLKMPPFPLPYTLVLQFGGRSWKKQMCGGTVVDSVIVRNQASQPPTLHPPSPERLPAICLISGHLIPAMVRWDRRDSCSSCNLHWVRANLGLQLFSWLAQTSGWNPEHHEDTGKVSTASFFYPETQIQPCSNPKIADICPFYYALFLVFFLSFKKQHK